MAKAKEVTEAVDTSAEETIQEEVQHSDWFYKVKDYYDTKRWNLVMVKNAVKKDKITEEEYEERLTSCKQCELLNAGTCGACGCYVELRATARAGHCPHKKW